jgi:hypothetical protein
MVELIRVQNLSRPQNAELIKFVVIGHDLLTLASGKVVTPLRRLW